MFVAGAGLTGEASFVFLVLDEVDGMGVFFFLASSDWLRELTRLLRFVFVAFGDAISDIEGDEGDWKEEGCCKTNEPGCVPLIMLDGVEERGLLMDGFLFRLVDDVLLVDEEALFNGCCWFLCWGEIGGKVKLFWSWDGSGLGVGGMGWLAGFEVDP